MERDPFRLYVSCRTAVPGKDQAEIVTRSRIRSMSCCQRIARGSTASVRRNGSVPVRGADGEGSYLKRPIPLPGAGIDPMMAYRYSKIHAHGVMQANYLK